MEVSRSRGFTLVEQLVVLLVASILLTVGVPSFARMFARARVQAAGSELAVSLALARMRAVTEQSSWSLCPSTDGVGCTGASDWTRGWIVFADPNELGRPSASDIAERVRPDDDGPEITGTAGRRLLSFRADGTSAGSNATLLLCAREHGVGRRIIVSNAGRTRTEALRDGDPACAG
ncbi:MAG TPA: GspH/FimT family pseudopilin [Xanthomonadales bacterium]|nr:GspH/FimT family pseudopilin [Xanthomonadales bacterium]